VATRVELGEFRDEARAPFNMFRSIYISAFSPAGGAFVTAGQASG
jgi:hypothetical protein